MQYTTIAVQPGRDPWEPHEKKDKKPKDPIVPEPATYLGVGLAIITVMLIKIWRKRS